MPAVLFKPTCIGFAAQYQSSGGPRPATIREITGIGLGGWGTGVVLTVSGIGDVTATYADAPGETGTFIFPGGVEPLSHAFARQVDTFPPQG